MAQLQASTVAGTLTTTGNVGIGYTNPSYKLQVNGTGYFNETLFVNGITTIEDRMVSIYDMFTGGAVGELRSSTSVAGNINFQGATAQGAGATGTTQQGITWQVNNYSGTTNYGIQAQLVVGNNGSVGTFMGLFTSDNYGAAPVERLRIQHNGNVGIGITTPTAPLHIVKDLGTGVSAVARLRGTNSTARTTRLQFEDYNGTIADGLIDFIIPTAGNSTGARLDIGVDSAIMSLVKGGNVGIGTVTPRKELDVQGNNLCVVAGQLILGEDAFSTSNSYMGLKTSFQSGANDYMILSGKSDGNTYVSARAGSSVYIRSGGNVSTAQIEVTDTYARTYSNLGVGTAPSTTLDILGKIKLGLDGTYGGSDYATIGFGGTSNGYNRVFGRASAADGLYLASATGCGISFRINGGSTDNMILNSSGNLGIGTDSPAFKLDVNGAVNTNSFFRTTETSLGIITDTITAFNAGIRLNSNDATRPITFEINSSEKMRIATSGNVGIGSTTPATKLDVNGNTTIRGSLAFKTTDTNNGNLIISDNGGGTATINNSANSFLDISSAASTTITAGNFIVNTNIGIGTTSPYAPLHVRVTGTPPTSGQQGFFGNMVLAGDAGQWNRLRFDTAATGSWGVAVNPDRKFVISRLDSSFSGTPDDSNFVIDTNGRIGIGTTSPVMYGGNGMEIASSGQTGIRLSSSTTGKVEIGADSVGGYIQTALAGNNLRFYTGNANPEVMVMTSGGNVGIGTTPPGYKLDVAGNARIGDNTAQQKFAALQVSSGQGSTTTYRDIDMCGSWAAGEGHAITANYSTGVNNIVGQIVFQHDSPGSRIRFGRLYDSGDQSTYPMNLVSNGSNGNLGINTTAPAADLHVDSGTTGATAYPFRVDASSLDYALYVSASGNVAVGGLVPAAALNHKFTVFSGSIALRGPNDPNFSYRLNDTGGTNRNALYVSSSNYLNVGNASFAGLQLFHTGSAPARNDGSNIQQYYGTDQTIYLAEPDNWLAIRINTTNYVIPMYQA